MPSATLWFPSDGRPDTTDNVVLWQQYRRDGDSMSEAYSLPQLVHDDAERWKQTYLDWLANIGQAPVGNKTLEQKMLIRPGLSYWWMTLPTEFSFSEDALVYKAVRLWAFVELAERVGLDAVELVGADPDVVSVLQAWGRETHRRITTVDPEHRRVRVIPGVRSVAKSSSVLIQFAAAVSWSARQFAWYGLKSRAKSRAAANTSREVTIVDYFDNFRIDHARASSYQSNYWGQLPEQLALMSIPVHWIHIDYRSAAAPSISRAREAVSALNENQVSQRHSLLQDSMSPRVVAAIIRQYFAAALHGLSVNRAGLSWRHTPSGLDMWPLIKRSWRSAFYGVAGAQNASWLCLFERVPTGHTSSGPCLYLMENQAWELALLSHWKASSSASIKGVPHSTVRAWDLRYAAGFAVGQGGVNEGLPRPDVVLVNGPAASGEFIRDGYRRNQLQPVEALRYMVSPQTPDCRNTKIGSEVVKILALGEYDARLATTQIELLNELIDARSPSVGITYRPHPSSTAPLAALDGRIRLSAASGVALDLAESDLAFCSNVSSASVDALLAGVPVIVFRDGSILDGQIAGALVNASVTSAASLIDAVDRFITHGSGGQTSVAEVFYLDAGLPRWTRVLTSS